MVVVSVVVAAASPHINLRCTGTIDPPKLFRFVTIIILRGQHQEHPGTSIYPRRLLLPHISREDSPFDSGLSLCSTQISGT